MIRVLRVPRLSREASLPKRVTLLLICTLAACSGAPFKPAPVQERSPTAAHDAPPLPATPPAPLRAPGASSGSPPPRGAIPPPPPNASALNGLMAPAPVGSGRADDPVAIATPFRTDGSAPAAARTAPNSAPAASAAQAKRGAPLSLSPSAVGAAVGDPAGLPTIDWSWPVDSPITAPYNDVRKGVDFTGALGAPVRAAAQGTVSYVGESLRGYGRMVVLKHEKGYISVYAHNSEVLVKDGEKVVRGQKIALMGSSDSKDVVLHFELRHQGRPLDPVRVLPGR